jgi:hypothetical protein
MTNQHPITPPRKLLDKWNNLPLSTEEIFVIVAQWGADQELEACCEWLENQPQWMEDLRAARRPKPPSLKEQALALVEQHEDGWRPSPKDWDTIRRALEALPDSIVVFPSQC